MTSQFSNLIRTDFWFNDGNIVLIAQNAAFKVHKGQLARHSEVFSDLFSLPQPSLSLKASDGKEDCDLIDGCPFVILQDSPSDVFYFLSALYDGLYFSPSTVPTRPHPPSFSSLSAVLRLSSKYLVQPLIQRCLFHLSLDWPISLSAWDEREARFTLHHPLSKPTATSTATSTPTSGRHNPTGSRYVPREFSPHPILIIQFALEMNIPEILPAALYDLSRYGPSKISHGTSLGPTAFDRFVAQLSEESNEQQQQQAPIPKTNIRLSRELLLQILRGREETQRFLASFIEKELYACPPSPFCQNLPRPTPSTPEPTSTSTPATQPTTAAAPQHNPCSDSFYFLLLNILRSVGGISFGRDADALFTLTQACDMLDRTDFYVSGTLNNNPPSPSPSPSPSLPSSPLSNSPSPPPLVSATYSNETTNTTTTDTDTTAERRTFGLNMCLVCKREFREKVRRAREEMWSFLPRWFGLIGEGDVGVDGVGVEARV